MKSIDNLLDTVQLGDSLKFLKTLPYECVDSIITSPPYFGQRDYGHKGQIGLEETAQEYIDALASVFREARRVLKPQGTFWLNIGDNYVGATSQHRGGGSQGKNSRYSRKHMNGIPTTGRKKRNKAFYAIGLPMKSLVGMPWLVAFALQSDGWILRCDIIWHRPSSSESVKDRPTHAHEYVFMFSKNQWYYYDRSAMLTDTGANIQSVWRITGSPFTGTHCATFPPELIEPIILASAPEGGVVLDPFGGSGTVGVVCRQHNRRFLLCDISKDNVALARKRISEGITANDKKRLYGKGRIDSRKIILTKAAHDYGNLNLKSCGKDFFPTDAIGGSSRKLGLGVPIIIKAKGIPKKIKTDIPTDSKTGRPRWIFRERSWVKEFVKVNKLNIGDTLVVDRIASREYFITPKHTSTVKLGTPNNATTGNLGTPYLFPQTKTCPPSSWRVKR